MRLTNLVLMPYGPPPSFGAQYSLVCARLVGYKMPMKRSSHSRLSYGRVNQKKNSERYRNASESWLSEMISRLQ